MQHLQFQGLALVAAVLAVLAVLVLAVVIKGVYGDFVDKHLLKLRPTTAVVKSAPPLKGGLFVKNTVRVEIGDDIDPDDVSHVLKACDKAARRWRNTVLEIWINSCGGEDHRRPAPAHR